MSRLRVAVVGAGGAGLLCARLLSAKHDVTLYEQEDRVGGNARHHTHRGSKHDLGVNVFHQSGYPNFFRVVDVLGVQTETCDLSINFCLNRQRRLSYDYNRQQIIGRNRLALCLQDAFYRRRVRRFVDFYLERNPHATYAELIDAIPASSQVKLTLRALCMGVWTMRACDIERFPARFVVDQFRELDLIDRARLNQWRCIRGGVSEYLDALRRPLGQSVRTRQTIVAVERHGCEVLIHNDAGDCARFDAAVMATPGDVTNRLIKTKNTIEKSHLPNFQSVNHPISLVYDSSRIEQDANDASIELSLYESAPDQFRTDRALTDLHLLTKGRQPPGYVLFHSRDESSWSAPDNVYTWTGTTPIITRSSIDAAAKHKEISGVDRIHYCGSWWGNGLHEAAVSSAIAVANDFGVGLEVLSRSRCQVL